MYQVHNRIPLKSEEHLQTLVEQFQSAPTRMKNVPGFHSFRLLKTEDGSHLIAETVFESKEHFVQWTQSEHFAKAHGGRRGSEDKKPNLESFEILI